MRCAQLHRCLAAGDAAGPPSGLVEQQAVPSSQFFDLQPHTPLPAWLGLGLGLGLAPRSTACGVIRAEVGHFGRAARPHRSPPIEHRALPSTAAQAECVAQPRAWAVGPGRPGQSEPRHRAALSRRGGCADPSVRPSPPAGTPSCPRNARGPARGGARAQQGDEISEMMRAAR